MREPRWQEYETRTGNALCAGRHDERSDPRDARRLKILLRHQGAARCRPHRLCPRNPCLNGRERRRQIDADEDPVGRLQARSRRRNPHRGQARAHRRPAWRPCGRHLDHLPGTFPRPQPERCGEYLSRPRALAVWLAGPRQHARGRRPDSRAGWVRTSRRRPWSLICPWASGNSSRSRVRCTRVKNPDHGRADHRAVGRRERAAVRADPPAPRRGSRHHLHLASHGRGVRARRPRHRAARRPAGRLARQAGDPRRHHRPDDGRARCLVVLQEGARSAGRARAPRADRRRHGRRAARQGLLA